MEPMDDFDSLLRAAAEEYNKIPFIEKDVSNMIDERLAASKKKLDLQFKKEINVIIACLSVFILIECTILFKKDFMLPAIAKVQHVADIGGITYTLVCLFMFRKLKQISTSQKDTHIRNYIGSIYKETQRVVRIYLWTSTGASIILIAIQLQHFPQLKWYWALTIWLVLGVAIHYANIWYIRKRFGKGIQEMKELMAEFE